VLFFTMGLAVFTMFCFLALRPRCKPRCDPGTVMKAVGEELRQGGRGDVEAGADCLAGSASRWCCWQRRCFSCARFAIGVGVRRGCNRTACWWQTLNFSPLKIPVAARHSKRDLLAKYDDSRVEFEAER